MAYDGSIRLSFGGGEVTFRLALGELQELEEVCGDRRPDGSIRRVGPNVILERLRSGSWLTADVQHTLRLGLMGGGMNQFDAAKFVERYVVTRPAWYDNSLIALAVLDASLQEPDESLGEHRAGEGEIGTNSSRTVDSPSPASTETPEP